MRKEIKRKYLIWENGIDYSNENLKAIYHSIRELRKDVLVNGGFIEQGYLHLGIGMEIARKLGLVLNFEPDSARLRKQGERKRCGKYKFYFALKSKGHGSRDEEEPEITPELFSEYWSQTRGERVEKVRLDVPYKGYVLQIDVFTDRDLILAEIEVGTEEELNCLEPVGLDVTEDKKYKNQHLAK